ncbi:MAG: sigma-70 family RNA polymerase sigma factor, partial [Pseudomonadota bacterium]
GYEKAATDQWDQAEQRDPERVLLGQDALRVAQAALDELPVLTKRMFILFRLHGLSQKAIAKRFGVSLSTVEKRIAKAAAHCHQRLVAHGVTGLATDRRLKSKPSSEVEHGDD